MTVCAFAAARAAATTAHDQHAAGQHEDRKSERRFVSYDASSGDARRTRRLGGRQPGGRDAVGGELALRGAVAVHQPDPPHGECGDANECHARTVRRDARIALIVENGNFAKAAGVPSGTEARRIWGEQLSNSHGCPAKTSELPVGSQSKSKGSGMQSARVMRATSVPSRFIA